MEKQLEELTLACCNMKCLVVIGEQNHSQCMCSYVMFCFVLFGGMKMMSGTKARYVCDHVKCGLYLTQSQERFLNCINPTTSSCILVTSRIRKVSQYCHNSPSCIYMVAVVHKALAGLG